jgi:hypothetical protein
MGNNLIDISKELLLNIEKIDDIVDEYFAPIKDYTDTINDIFTPIKAIHSLYTINKKRRFKNFLKAYAHGLHSEDFNNIMSVERLKTYLKDEKNFNFLTEVIENAINAKSIYGSIILGYYAGQILSNEQNITFKDIIIIEALKSLNDFELSCFARIYNVADLGSEEVNIRHYDSLKPFTFFCELTIEKMVQLRVLEKGKRVDMYEWRKVFKSTDIAEDMFVYIESANILSELLEYKF